MNANPFIQDLIIKQKQTERTLIKEINLELAANFFITLKALINHYTKLYGEHSREIVITNCNLKRFETNRYYTLKGGL